MKLGVPLLRYSSALGLGGLVWLVVGVIAFTPPPPAAQKHNAHPWQPLPLALPAVADTPEALPDTVPPHPDAARFRAAAELAFRQFDRLWRDRTGLANATPDYDKLTSWDVGSVLAAVYSARILDLIDEEEYNRRIGITLRTINELPLYRGVAYHKLYSSSTGKMVSRGGGYTTRGYGWSATDLGRLLVWLHIIERNDPAHADLATSAAQRIAFDSIVAGGYVYGEERRGNGSRRRFQEGRIGYEQYVAFGFDAWGADVARALDVRTNAVPVDVAGVELMGDRRGLDRIVSEPFVLMGLETGWEPEMRKLALAVLQAQENHSATSGTVTIGSEDAIGIAPYYFYYFCVYCSGEAFVVESANPGSALDVPRWLSTKMAFGWHALAPSDFTQSAVDLAASARGATGWSSGVFIESKSPTRTLDINTAAVILEAAAYIELRRPLIEWRAGPSQRPVEAP